MDIQINGQKVTLEKLRWNDYAKMEEKFGTLQVEAGKTMVQARYALWLSVQRADHKDITEEQIGEHVDPALIPEIVKVLFPEARDSSGRPLA